MRRRLTWVLLFGAVLLGAGSLHGAALLNRIQKENRQPGTTAWELTSPADNRQIEGYASLTSVPVGGNISLFVNTADATYSLTVYRMGWYGGKGGRKVLGPQLLAGVQQVTPTPDPTTGVFECKWTNPFTMHVPTSWLSGIYLVKLHGNASGKESYIIFTVRDSRRADLIFQQSVTTYQAYNGWPGTSAFGGHGQSLYGGDFYTGGPDGSSIPARVSFNRPYASDLGAGPPYGVGAGDFLRNAAPAAMEFGMLRWIEHNGYDVTYITDVDTHEDAGRLLRGKAFLSIGHDEYWSETMRANVIQARDAGVSLGFFGGNYLYWPTQFSPDSKGNPNRALAVDKTFGADGTFAGSRYNESEQLIVGGMWGPGHNNTNGDIFVNPRKEPTDAPLNHWVFSGTGLQEGDVIPGLIGIEYNAINPGFAVPSGMLTLIHTQVPDFGNTPGGGGFRLPDDFDGKDFNTWYDQAQAVAAANAGQYDFDQKTCRANPASTCTIDQDCGVDSNGNPVDACVFPCDQSPIPPLKIPPPPGGWLVPSGDKACSNPFPEWLVFGTRTDWSMTIYQAGSGAWVFNAATNQWSWGLDDYFTGLVTADGANNGPAIRTQCGYPWFHPGLVSCRHPAVDQITRNVLNKFIGR
jgi:hypothetical protein